MNKNRPIPSESDFLCQFLGEKQKQREQRKEKGRRKVEEERKSEVVEKGCRVRKQETRKRFRLKSKGPEIIHAKITLTLRQCEIESFSSIG